MQEDIPKNPVSFVVFISKKQKKWVGLSILAVLIATSLDKLSVLILKQLTDSVTQRQINTDSLWFFALLYPFTILLMRNLWRVSGFTGMRWFMGNIATTNKTLYEYLTLHSKDYFNNRFAGALASKISNAVDGSDFLLEKVLWRFIPLVIGVIWYVFIAWFSNIWLGLVLLVWSIAFLIVNIYFVKKMQPLSVNSAEAGSVLKGKIVDSLSNISLVHEYAYVAGEREYINKYINRSRDAGLKVWRYSEWVLVLNGILISLFDFAMILVAIYMFLQNQVTLGVVIMVIAIITDLSGNFIFIAQEIRDTASHFGQLKEGLGEILTDHTIKDRPNAKPAVFRKGKITIDSIDFEYENTIVFKNFSLEIPAGQKIGIVGRSGAGKTTFVALLLRHFEVQSGTIKIDGQNIYEVKLESLRKAIAFVPQDTGLFHRTIKANISYSNPNATDEEIIRASRLSQSEEFIKKLPKGYDTLVGERGVKLSGGQRQRVSIARAFLKNSPILILDEATSSLDSESEHAIQISLDDLMKDRTVIAVAHRLSTLKKMDRIVIIEDGKVVEDGSPEELLKNKDGHFKKMWDHQVKGFIIDE